MLRTVLPIVIVIWMLGLVFHFGGNILPLLLVVAAIVLVMKYMFRRRTLN
jgi:ABC-type iron transport system FetAB permease component